MQILTIPNVFLHRLGKRKLYHDVVNLQINRRTHGEPPLKCSLEVNTHGWNHGHGIANNNIELEIRRPTCQPSLCLLLAQVS